MRQTKLREDEEKRTVWLGVGPKRFPGHGNKPYHWELEDGRLVLKPGMTEHEKIRADIIDRMIKAGIEPDDITPEMIERVVSKAETAAMMAEIERTAADAPQEP